VRAVLVLRIAAPVSVNVARIQTVTAAYTIHSVDLRVEARAYWVVGGHLHRVLASVPHSRVVALLEDMIHCYLLVHLRPSYWAVDEGKDHLEAVVCCNLEVDRDLWRSRRCRRNARDHQDLLWSHHCSSHRRYRHQFPYCFHLHP
jgi:hypothetical protein